MASLFKRPRSPYWWIKFRDPKTGNRKAESTGLKFGVGIDTRKAQELCAVRTLEEKRIAKFSSAEKWDEWVPEFLAERYCNAPATLARYQTAWRTLRIFFAEKNIDIPRQLLREQCQGYAAWRKKPDQKIGKFKAGHNTAVLEFRLLALLMKEAVLRKYAPYSPCAELEMKRLPGKPKPEYPPEIIALIREKIELESEPLRTFYRNSFEIAHYHGVRISETYLNPLTAITVENMVVDGEAKKVYIITFRTKGGKHHTVHLHPNLIPLFDALRKARKTETYIRPKNLSRAWFDFLKRHGFKQKMPNICFHSHRITAATVMARKGVPQRLAMAYLGHASTTVHQIYVKLNPEDLSSCADAIV